MSDERYTVSVTALVAVILWALTAAAFVASILWPIEALGRGCLLLGMLAATATVRRYFVRQAEMVTNAFVLGRDVGRNESSTDAQVHSIR